MDKFNKARKDMLKSQLEFAVVEHVGTEADDYPSYDVGTYSVFIPGAVREHNLVKAKDEAEAKAKVLACLEKKIDVMSQKPSDVEISPDNLKHTMKTKVKIEEN